MIKLWRNGLAYLRDPDVALWRKLTGALALAYTAWPLDAIPDVIPGIGWLDDIGVLGVVAVFLMRDIHKHAAKQLGSTR